ncbi:secretion protein HlyD [Desulfosarcina alkanivorans]|uniref:Secretion protein HlyD n=1 Tax=Desulfosarcina alkanivorans TaxID=571177 RepID=A0A5K7YJC6_9BACT|nr:efflux RND transporter periplasmic adaptor subunit [Desulfosarcina alkanivorans]BBO69296.1 secretion protein HlyD [Desulfosarcina alkanivorans]
MKKNPRFTGWPTGLCIAAAMVLLGGCDKIEPGVFTAVEKAPFSPGRTAAAEVRETDQVYEAVGTVRPRTETRIEARVTGQVLDVRVSPGDPVTKGQLLVSLDSRQMTSRLNQARQALKTAEAGREQARHLLEGARAGFKQARANYDRVRRYFDSQAATAQDLEQAESTFRQAEAGVKRAEEGLAAAKAGILQARAVVDESTISIEYTRILAPEDGVVLKRFVEPGDLALPGKPLLALRTSGAMRLEAYVREGLITRVEPGASLDVDIETLDRLVAATVEEIVPYADPNSRTFLVKASMPPVEGLYPGMFGKLRIPVGRQRIVTMPWAAVRRVGQLELVHVKAGDGWQTRHVKTGVRLGDAVEVLSGLDGSETLGWEVSDNG